MLRRSSLSLLTLILVLALPASANSASRLTIRGKGWGHGVGMSQWGAKGLAEQGRTYREILSHYYTGTAIGTLPKGHTVRVLLRGAAGIQRFTGATRAAGRRVSATRTYGVRRAADGSVQLLSARGRVLTTTTSPLVASAGGTKPVVLRGRALNGVSSGEYRGRLEFRAQLLGVAAINAIGIETYVRGVIARESPASWPAAALEAQAVAARSYAVTTNKPGDGFDHYPDTRSQVYGGADAETPTTDAAVAATSLQVVTHNGQPVVTYFFSTSGGRTEDVENTSLGDEPLPWLKSVEDPFDSVSPKHRWGPIRMSMGSAQRKLGGLVKGSFRGIDVIQRGKSPRIVLADVVGTDGRTRVAGSVLRAKLGLNDTWAYFTSITTDDEPTEQEAEGEPTPEPQPTDSTGGTSPPARAAAALGRSLTGRVVPAPAGSYVRVEKAVEGAWARVGLVVVDERGRYAFALPSTGDYRVVYRGDAGPRVRVRWLTPRCRPALQEHACHDRHSPHLARARRDRHRR